jgi:hypothetical protein
MKNRLLPMGDYTKELKFGPQNQSKKKGVGLVSNPRTIKKFFDKVIT